METPNEARGRRPLGRGIGSLLGISSGEASSSKEQVVNIPLVEVYPSSIQPRVNFSSNELSELAQSIREKGVIQPIVVRPRSEGGYEIIAGERRWRASQIAGKDTIPAVVKNLGDHEALELAIIENVQRQNLNPVEEALAYQRLMRDFGLTQSQIAEKIGKDRTTIANLCRILHLPQEVLKLVEEGKLTLGHAKALLSLETAPEQIRWGTLAVQNQWSVRKLERSLLKKQEKELNSQDVRRKEGGDEAWRISVEDSLRSNWRTQIYLRGDLNHGSIEFQYHSREELDYILERLLHPPH